MATKITDTDHPWALAGAAERRLCEAPDGTLWAVVVTASRKVKFFRSRNQGASWEYASTSDLDTSQHSTVVGMFIDADGYAHVVWAYWDVSPQSIRYSRGTPSSSGSNWHWKTHSLYPAAGRLGKDCDVVAYRNGTGWTAWIYFPLYEIGHRVARVDISPSGSLTTVSSIIDIGNSGGNYPFGGLEFAHSGDGWTPSASPHVFVYTGSMRTLSGGAQPPLRLHRGRYQSGAWTWNESVLLESITIGESTLVGIWDGALMCVAWSPSGTNGVRFATWDGVAASATRNDPPALPGGLGSTNGLTMAHDPVSGDLFVLIHDKTDGDIRWTRLTRTTNTWSAWTIAVTRTAFDLDNKVSALRHPAFGNVDFLYANYTTTTSGKLYHQRLLQLSRTPLVPSLLDPPNGAVRDMTGGGTFLWKYNKTSLGDSQQGWFFRRTYGDPIVTEYWNNSSKMWSSTEVYNAGTLQMVAFPASSWTAGSTYAWTVKTRSASGADSAYAPQRTIVITSAPVVDVVEPSGLVYSESTPRVSWTYTGADAQRDYEVRIVQVAAGIDPTNPGPSVWTSGVVTNSVARDVVVDDPLLGGVAYRAYVRATNVNSVASAWDYSEFSLSLVPPTGPRIGVVDELAWPSDIPRVRLNVQGRSNHMTQSQAMGQTGWASNANAVVAAKPADLASMIEDSLQITTVASGPASAITTPGDPPVVPDDVEQPLGPIDFPVLGGASYTALGATMATVAARAARVTIVWYDSHDKNPDGTPAGSVISSSNGDQVNLTTGAYTQAYVSATAPEGAKLGRVVHEMLGAAAAGEIFYVTRSSFHPSLVATWQPGNFADTQTIRVERSLDDGTTWEQIEDSVKTDYWQRATVRDRTMPLGVTVHYRGYTDVDLGDGTVLESEVSSVATGVIDTPAWVIRDPEDDDGEVFAYVLAHSRSDEEAAAVHRPAGREFPVIDSEGRRSVEGTIDLYVPQDRIQATVELLRRPKMLVVQSPIGELVKARFLSRDISVEALRHRAVSLRYFEVQ